MEVLKSKVAKVVAYLVTSGVLAEILEVAVRHLSEAELSDTTKMVAMGVINLILVLLVKRGSALKA